MRIPIAVTVRPARLDEHDEIRDLLRAAYQEYSADLPPHIFQNYLAGLLNLNGSSGRPVTLVALCDGRIAGTTRFYPPDDTGSVRWPANWAWLRAVGVAPDLRGAGIARELMADCARRAVAGGAVALGLNTMVFMPAAIRLYERLGYRRAPEWDLDVAAFYQLPPDPRLVAPAYHLDLSPPQPQP